MDMLGIGKNSVSEAADRLKNWKMTGGKVRALWVVVESFFGCNPNSYSHLTQLAGDLGRAIEFACTDRVPKSTHPRP